MASRVGVNLRASAYLHQGDRKYMEDEFQVAYQRTQDKKDIEYAFFGIFDGHGGKEAAHYAKDNLMDNIVSQRLFWSENDDDILCAIKEGFMQTHMAMWKELDQWPRTASGWPSTSGTTASIAFIRHQKIYIGHVGDSGIVLGYEDCNNEWTGVSLTKDHKPESLMEMNRINECGGKVIAKSGVPRVVWNRPKSGHQGPVRRSTPMDEIPFLAVARSLGDLWSYNASHNEFVVSPEPDVCVVEIDVSSYRCLIFGTDGLWNALSPSHAVAIAFNSEKNNEKHYLGVPLDSGKTRIWLNPSRCIVTGALERYQRVGIRADNTSSVTVFLDPPGRPKKEVLRQQMLAKKSCGASRNSVSTTKSQSTKKGSVKIHVYNNSSNESPCGGVLCLKERFPESTPASPDPKGDPIHSPQDLVFKPSECDSVHANSPALPKTCGSVSSHSSHESISDDKKSHSCCCYTPNHSSVCSSNSPSSNDAIQIPLISSSSSSADDLSTSVDVPKKAVTHDTFSCSSRPSVIASPRRTRSFFNMAHLQASSVEKKGESDLPLTHCEPSVGHQSILLTPDVGDRVLKNVNRGSSTVSAASTKRKRLNDFLLQEEHCSKSARVNTRSISLSHKPMITRSQQRRSRNRKKAPNN